MPGSGLGGLDDGKVDARGRLLGKWPAEGSAGIAEGLLVARHLGLARRTAIEMLGEGNLRLRRHLVVEEVDQSLLDLGAVHGVLPTAAVPLSSRSSSRAPRKRSRA